MAADALQVRVVNTMPREVLVHTLSNIIVTGRPPKQRGAAELRNRHCRIGRHAAADF